MSVNLDLFAQLIAFGFSAMLIGLVTAMLFDFVGYGVFRFLKIINIR